MRADLLGSTFLTILVRCPCGRKNYLSRVEWERLGFLLCDNCSAWIRYNDLTVNDSHGGDCMDDLGLTYERTEEREAIVRGLDSARVELEGVAEKLRQLGARDRAHKVLNIAQSVAAQGCLLAQDWSITDREGSGVDDRAA